MSEREREGKVKKQKKDIVIIVNVTTCIYNAFSSNWHRKCCVIFHEMFVAMKCVISLYISVLWRHETSLRFLSNLKINSKCTCSVSGLKLFAIYEYLKEWSQFISESWQMTFVSLKINKTSTRTSKVITIKCNEMWEILFPNKTTCSSLLSSLV